jgi:hypothetical protein
MPQDGSADAKLQVLGKLSPSHGVRLVCARPQSATHAAENENHAALFLAGRPMMVEKHVRKMPQDDSEGAKLQEPGKRSPSEGVRIFSRMGSSLWSQDVDESSLFGGANRLTGVWQRGQGDKSQRNKLESSKGTDAVLESRHVDAVAVASAAASVSALSATYGRSNKLLSVLALIEHKDTSLAETPPPFAEPSHARQPPHRPRKGSCEATANG